ncbi:TonB-system energizer ExbB [Halorhodospira neutriphila]|uniref:TonB-system energizer ExbB n=1 Tax=Halorhodospira neutriphila TaxID=168379 RepID=A0ABS1E513_9GAMM|nr:TonB-system energizer ExbB [Halorhodospira neutriphila]MBK1725909.1 TonB-system energizer ExbB [Halorhodospira neutriphila]
MELLKEYLDYAVIGLLGAMLFLAVALSVERWLYYRQVAVEQFDHLETFRAALTRNLTAIASVGANAPYVGLLGTVLGIMITFYDLGQGGAIETAAVMTGLALALKATALGLAVAIPSILLYNGLMRRVEVLVAEWRRVHGA